MRTGLVFLLVNGYGSLHDLTNPGRSVTVPDCIMSCCCRCRVSNSKCRKEAELLASARDNAKVRLQHQAQQGYHCGLHAAWCISAGLLTCSRAAPTAALLDAAAADCAAAAFCNTVCSRQQSSSCFSAATRAEAASAPGPANAALSHVWASSPVLPRERSASCASSSARRWRRSGSGSAGLCEAGQLPWAVCCWCFGHTAMVT